MTRTAKEIVQGAVELELVADDNYGHAKLVTTRYVIANVCREINDELQPLIQRGESVREMVVDAVHEVLQERGYTSRNHGGTYEIPRSKQVEIDSWSRV